MPYLTFSQETVASSIVNAKLGVIFKESGHGPKSQFSFMNYMGIIGGFSGNNRIVQEAVQNRIIGRFWNTLATSLTIDPA